MEIRFPIDLDPKTIPVVSKSSQTTPLQTKMANIQRLDSLITKAVSMNYVRTTLRCTDEEARSLFNPCPRNYEIVKELTWLSTQKNDGGVWIFKHKGYVNLQYVQNIDRVV